MKGKRLVWTMAYNAWVTGGKTEYPVGCELECDGPHPLGRKYRGYLVTAPNGETFLAEASSGAFVGQSIEEVRSDIRTGNPTTMRRQVDEAVALAPQVKVVDASEFWGLLRCNE